MRTCTAARNPVYETHPTLPSKALPESMKAYEQWTAATRLKRAISSLNIFCREPRRDRSPSWTDPETRTSQEVARIISPRQRCHSGEGLESKETQTQTRAASPFLRRGSALTSPAKSHRGEQAVENYLLPNCVSRPTEPPAQNSSTAVAAKQTTPFLSRDPSAETEGANHTRNSRTTHNRKRYTNTSSDTSIAVFIYNLDANQQ